MNKEYRPFYAMAIDRAYIDGFLEPESPNFVPNHAFLSSIEAEIITFLSKKVAILGFGFYSHPINISTWPPSRIDS